MKKIRIILLLSLFLGFNNLSYSLTQPSVDTKPVQKVQQPVLASVSVKPLDVVSNPNAYLTKRISMVSKFSKFSSLGLDYEPAMRASDKYVTCLFLRDDSVNNIPLSELKMFVPRKIAETIPDVKEGEKINIVGTVFSTALGDVWLDVERFNLIKK